MNYGTFAPMYFPSQERKFHVTFALGSESSRERKFYGTKVPGSESCRERKFYGTIVLGSKSSRERKFHLWNFLSWEPTKVPVTSHINVTPNMTSQLPDVIGSVCSACRAAVHTVIMVPLYFAVSTCRW